MATWKDKLGKLGVFDCISPHDLPEPQEVSEYPKPWKEEDGGNGHTYLYDANGRPLFHVFCWDEKDGEEYDKKMKQINGSGA